MARLFYVLGMALALWPVMLVSQGDDGAAPPLHHEKRFYTAPDGRLYVALGLLVLLVSVACSKAAETPADSSASQVWSLAPTSPTGPPAAGPLTRSGSGASEPASAPSVPPAPLSRASDRPTPAPFALDIPDVPADATILAELSPRGPKSVSRSEFHQVFPRDWILPIYSPKIAAASEVELRADELVMGVIVNGESRAYPLETLRSREIVNDELGGVPILVTF